MAGILVGDDACPTSDIVSIFGKRSMEVVMMDEWSHFANVLQLPPALVKKLQRDLLLDKIVIADILDELLINWRSSKGNMATVGNLLNIVIDNFAWKEVEDFLRKKIQDHARNFDDLDSVSKTKVLSSKLKFLGKEWDLNSIKSQMKEIEFTEALNECVGSDFIQKALNDETIELDQSELPTELPYYINRTLTWKRRINPVMFREACPDIFVFEGIQRHHLTMLARPNLTDLSRSQLRYLKVRFILLECEYDFQEILKQAEVPVHRILYKDDLYYWTFTVGSLRIIRSFLIDDEPEEIGEQALVEKHLTIFSSRPLTIVSSPGMGKSVLLASVAHKVQGEYPKRIVLFMEMRSFIQQQHITLKKLNLHVIKDFIATYISEGILGQKLIRKLLDNKANQFEVFLDGFDEMSLDQIKAAKEILACLLESKNIRAHITSRPHMRDELENTVGVISLDIIPFQANDQIEFLTGFWKNQLQVQNMEKLSSFAVIAIKDISSDFIGVPFQCFLLAQIYSKEVQRFSNFDTYFYQITNPSKSLFDLYNKFFDTRFENVSHEDRDYIRKYHWVEALKLLFSNDVLAIRIHEKLEAEICERFCSPDSIYAVGILQPESAVNCPVFVHRTLAEFLVGEMIAEYFRGNQLSDCETMVPFILETILASCADIDEMDLVTDERSKWVANTMKIICKCERGSKLELHSRFISALLPDFHGLLAEIEEKDFINILNLWILKTGSHATYGTLVRILNKQRFTEFVDELKKTAHIHAQGFTFINNMVCFFLDANLATCQHYINESSRVIMHVNRLTQNKDSQLFEDGFKQVHLLTKKGFKHLLARIALLLWDERDSPLKIPDSQELLNCAASYGDVELFQCCREIVDKFGEIKVAEIRFKQKIYKGTEYEQTPLHCALRRGNYKLSEYLITSYEDKLVGMKFLYEYTLQGSWNDSPDKIKDKIIILKLLKSINVYFDVKSAIEIPNVKGIHPELFISFANLIGYTPKKGDEEFLRDCVGLGIRNDFQMNLFVDWLVLNDQRSFFMLVGNTIGSLLFFNNMLPDTLAKIYESCPFDLGDYLWSAVYCKRGEEFVKLIVNISGNVNITNSDKYTMLHHAAELKKPNIIRYLLSVGADVNLKNYKGKTALSLAHENDYFPNFNQFQECINLLTETHQCRKKVNWFRRKPVLSRPPNKWLVL